MNFRPFLLAAAVFVCGVGRAAPVAVIVAAPDASLPVGTMISTALKDAGYAASRQSFEQALEPGAFSGAAVVVLQDATELPADLHAPIEQFVRGGGDLIAFGLPAWKVSLLKLGQRWVPSDEYAKEAAWTPAPHPVGNIGTDMLRAWKRSHGQTDGPTTYEIATQPGFGPVLHATLPNMTGWDTLVSPALNAPFPKGFDRTVFTAKGDPNTTALSVEWREKDGSRWIGVVPLTPEWRRYELRPEDFHYWHSNDKRGGRDDRFHPENAESLSVGLAFSHTGAVPGPKEWWMGNLGTARAQDAPLSALNAAPELDGLYPGYKSFPIGGKLRLSPPPGSPFSEMKVKADAVLFSPHPRPSGSGYDKDRRVRFVTFLEAQSREGAWRGAPVSAFVHTKEPYKGSTWTIVGTTSPSVLMDPAFVVGLTAAAKWMREPRLAEGGTNWYTYFPGMAMTIGARLADPADPGLTVRAAITDPATGETAWSKTWDATDTPMSATWQPPADAKGPWTVSVDLLRDGETLDHIEHSVHIWSPSPIPRFITTEGGRFLLAGKPWKAHGVNYMPSTGVARDLPIDAEEFEHWIGAAGYDADVVSRDLDNVRQMKLNALSAFIYGGSVGSGNLLDFLRQAEERGMHVNLSLRPGTPLDFEWDQVRSIIEAYRLRDNDVVFAYDLAWEPSWGGRDARAKYDPQWTQWVVQKYGSLPSAGKAWGYEAERSGDQLANPANEQTVTEGPWTKMVLDYRAFLNGLLADAYGHARDLVRSLDPNHAVSFRMTETSNPTYDWSPNLPYDFMGLTDAVHIFAPEGYGRRGDWEKVKPGWFQVEYARAVDPNKPVIWAEGGENIWQPGLHEAPPERKELQAMEFSAFYEMLNKSGSNGVFWWWYPGGFRTGENSDYGIINPDGTDRPVTKVIRDNADSFLNGPAPVPTNAEVVIHLKYASGLFGAYMAAQDEFWALVAEGKRPRVVVGDAAGAATR
jgi:hypothetical protein